MWKINKRREQLPICVVTCQQHCHQIARTANTHWRNNALQQRTEVALFWFLSLQPSPVFSSVPADEGKKRNKPKFWTSTTTTTRVDCSSGSRVERKPRKAWTRSFGGRGKIEKAFDQSAAGQEEGKTTRGSACACACVCARGCVCACVSAKVLEEKIKAGEQDGGREWEHEWVRVRACKSERERVCAIGNKNTRTAIIVARTTDPSHSPFSQTSLH